MRKKTSFLIYPLLIVGVLLVFASSCKKDEVNKNDNNFTDSRDGNVYKTVRIGKQTWMAENLKYLPDVVGPGTGSEKTPYYYVYDYDGTDVNAAKATSNYRTYGVLYNWPAAMAAYSSSTANPSGVQGVCPTGWHLPSDDEWTQFSTYLLDSYVKDEQKKTGTSYWNSPKTRATNESGFRALPGGYRYGVGAFDGIDSHGFWWCSTELNTTSAWYRSMIYGYSYIYREDYGKEMGFSVRCVRD